MKRCLECDRTYEAGQWLCPACGFRVAGNRHLRFAPDLAAATDDYRPELFSRFDAFEQGNWFWFRARQRLIGWALDRYLPTATTFLEVGCGQGSILAYLGRTRPQLRLSGGDAFDEALDLAADRLSGVQLMQLDARRLPFEDEFDAIGAFDVIEHIDDDREVLTAIRRALRPGGGMILTVPQHPWLWSAYDDFARHKRRYRRQELVGKVATAGFDLVLVTSFVTLPLPALAISRLLARHAGPDFDPIAAGSSPRRMAGLLDRILRVEAAALRRGWSPRAGGSLLLVAHRSRAG